MSIKKGITTQTEVLEKFGAPNIATVDCSGYDSLQTHQKYATVAKSTDSRTYATVIIVGGTGASSGFEQSITRTMSSHY